MVLIMITLLAIVSELGLSASLIKFVNEARSEEERKRLVSTILAGSLMLALPIAAVCAAYAGHLSRLLLGSSEYSSLVMIGVAGGLGAAVLQVGLSFERANARSFRYLLYTLAKGGLSLGLSVVLVVALSKGAAGLLIGTALPPLAIGLVIYGRLFAGFGVRFARSAFKAIVAFGGPLVPMNLAMWVLGSADIYLLRLLGPGNGALSEVGLYQYAHEVCLVLVLPVTALNLAWPQFLFSNHSRPEGAALFARVHTYFSFFLIAVAFVFSAFAGQILEVVGTARYSGSAEVIPLLAGSLVFYGLSIVFASGLYVAGRTRTLAGIVAVCACINVALNVGLIPSLGKQGAALAALVSNLAMAVLVLAYSQASFRIPFRIGPTAGAIALAAAGIVCMNLAAPRLPPAMNIPLRALAVCGFLPGLAATLGLGRRDFVNAARIARTLGRTGAPSEVL
jgi:O-antigen/teichoic acid export membrane protein